MMFNVEPALEGLDGDEELHATQAAAAIATDSAWQMVRITHVPPRVGWSKTRTIAGEMEMPCYAETIGGTGW